MTIIIPRRAYEAQNPPQELSLFQDNPAWILLGDSGLGKTTSLREEAKKINGVFLRVAEFISCDPKPDWHGKTLFLDGLDELRVNGRGPDVLFSIRKQLQKLGNPPFRISCRGSEWYGMTDINDIENIGLDRKISILQLAPLNDKEIIYILKEKHEIQDTDHFFENTKKHGLFNLLSNPQTLELLVKAFKSGFPETRDEVFRLACETIADENNKFHRDSNNSKLISRERVISAAGQLCATLLFSNKFGVALDSSTSNQEFPAFDQMMLSDKDAANIAIRRNLFYLESSEKLIPAHRSIAEYLASSWLAEQIDHKKIPITRILNLLIGLNDRTVTGLRGLYGWLALHCKTARKRLIEIDPLTVITYGDVKPMTSNDKKHILQHLSQETGDISNFIENVQNNYFFAPLEALADSALQNDYLAILQSSDRSDANQLRTECVLLILANNNLFDFQSALLSIIKDDTWWLMIRANALKIWLKKDNVSLALELLQDIAIGTIVDHDDELMAQLLDYLYPDHIKPNDLFKYLKPPKSSSFGIYERFLMDKLPKKARAVDLPILMNELIKFLRKSSANIDHQSRFNQMASKTLLRALTEHGDNVEDGLLYDWLEIKVYRDDIKDEIKNWIEMRSEKYKGLINILFERCTNVENAPTCFYQNIYRLNGASPPHDLGNWYRNKALTVPDTLVEVCLAQWLIPLVKQCRSEGKPLETLIEAINRDHPKAEEWLKKYLASESTFHKENEIYKNNYEKKQNELRNKNTNKISEYLTLIPEGIAPANIMYELAGVWEHRYLEAHGNTITERFENFYEDGQAIQKLAEKGFKKICFRQDLPTANEIIAMHVKKNEFLLQHPSLLGMKLIWKDDESQIKSLSADILRCMIAFQLIDTSQIPNWFTYLVSNHPALIADVLVQYANAVLKVSDLFVNAIYPLEHDAHYKEIAIIAVPKLLKSFPLRACQNQLKILKHLLKAALHYAPKELALIAKTKITRKLNNSQKIYWQIINVFLNPTGNHETFWNYVSKIETRARHLCEFLGNDSNHNKNYLCELPPTVIGKLIEAITPYAKIELLSSVGPPTEIRSRGCKVLELINYLGAMLTTEAEQELNRLLNLKKLKNIEAKLQTALNQQKNRIREKLFYFLDVNDVTRILANENPTNVADLASLTLDVIATIANNLLTDNDDGICAFWNIKNMHPDGPREENLCRDELLRRLRNFLSTYGIDCQPEANYVNDKRADIRLSYHAKFALPIEIKCDNNTSLWSGLRDQLIKPYSIAPEAEGYGIYLVLWFGEKGNGVKNSDDGLKKPKSPEELKQRLENRLKPDERKRIFIQVLDMSWQKK